MIFQLFTHYGFFYSVNLNDYCLLQNNDYQLVVKMCVNRSL